MRHHSSIISTQTLQGATGANFCRILDRDTALESSNTKHYDGAHPQVTLCAHIRHIVMSTQQAQKSNFLHDVPFVCHMCADNFVTYVWIRFEKYWQFPVLWSSVSEPLKNVCSLLEELVFQLNNCGEILILRETYYCSSTTSDIVPEHFTASTETTFQFFS